MPESEAEFRMRKARRKSGAGKRGGISGCRKARLGIEYASSVVVFAGPLSSDYYRKTRTLHSGDGGTHGMSADPHSHPYPFSPSDSGPRRHVSVGISALNKSDNKSICGVS